jgi:hypothetical protein
MDKPIQDVMGSTVGWFAFAVGTVGVTPGETLRLSVVNLSPSGVIVFCGLWSNPRPVPLAEDAYTLDAGEAKNCRDVKGSDLSRELFDETGRAQIRALVRSSCPTVFSTLEVFDSETGRTSIALPLQNVVHRD